MKSDKNLKDRREHMNRNRKRILSLALCFSLLLGAGVNSEGLKAKEKEETAGKKEEYIIKTKSSSSFDTVKKEVGR